MGGRRRADTGASSGTVVTREPRWGQPVPSMPYQQTSALDPVFINADFTECCRVEKTGGPNDRSAEPSTFALEELPVGGQALVQVGRG